MTSSSIATLTIGQQLNSNAANLLCVLGPHGLEAHCNGHYDNKDITDKDQILVEFIYVMSCN